MDRASGSGVFARDPDALIDLVELEVTEELTTQRLNQAACKIYQKALQERNNDYYQQHVSLDDLQSAAQMRTHFEKGVSDVLVRSPYQEELKRVRNAIQMATAWRVEGTLREFAKFKPVNMWFSYPVHSVDETGVLADIQLEDDKPNWQRAAAKAREGRKTIEQNLEERNQILEDAYNKQKNFNPDAPVTKQDIAELTGIKERTVEKYVREHEGFILKNGNVIKIN